MNANNNIRNVSKEKIIRLQSCADGFRSSFFVIINSFLGKCEDEKQKWYQDGDGMSPAGTNGCFAIELYLKFLMVLISFNEATLSGHHKIGHDLLMLYDELKQMNQSIVDELENEYKNLKYKENTLRDLLLKIRNQFENWRYCYDKGTLNINANEISDLLNLLHSFCNKKYRPVAEKLAENLNESLPTDEQSMSINNIDDINKEFWVE